MSTSAVDQQGTVRTCLFILAGQPFAVDVQYTREVVVLDDCTIVPRAPSQLVGVANLRGLILPLLDIGPLLGLPPRRIAGGTKALVIQLAAVQVAVLIDDVLRLESFDEITPFGDAARSECEEFGMGLLPWGNRLVTLLNVPKILEALRIGSKGG